MAERVYTFAKADQQRLKELLAYDPYLDTKLIEKRDEGRRHEAALPGDESEEHIAERKRVGEVIRKLAEDEYAGIIFARQKHELREGDALGLDSGRLYLYIEANEQFLDKAERLLRERFGSCERAKAGDEKRVIEVIRDEESRANEGIGAIFG